MARLAKLKSFIPQRTFIRRKPPLPHAYLEELDTPVISMIEVRRFIVDCVDSLGAPHIHSEALGDMLVQADYRGEHAYGMNKFQSYINDIRNCVVDVSATPKMIKDTPATAWMDGHNGLGVVTADVCMDLAIKKGKKVGAAFVSCKRANPFGLGSNYTKKAIKQGLIAFAFQNFSPILVPTRACEPALGGNPIVFAAPSVCTDSFVLETTTTVVPTGMIEVQLKQNKPIPQGWAFGPDGKFITDAKAALETRRFAPLGGLEETFGYKGYGLSLMVEILSGILSGSLYGPKIRKYGQHDVEMNLGQSFLVIKPRVFAPNYRDRMNDFLTTLRNLKPADPKNPVWVAGDKEREHMALVDRVGGLQFLPKQMEICDNLAKELKVTPLRPRAVTGY